MSKHAKDITWRVSCSSKEQRDRLKAKANELSSIMELENAEMLEYLFDRNLPRKLEKTAMDRTPLAATDGVRPDEDI